MVVASALNENTEQFYPATWNHDFIDDLTTTPCFGLACPPVTSATGSRKPMVTS